MFQTDQATASNTLPTPATAGTQGYFTNGNPSSGVAATILDADFMNMVMMELVNVVTAAGLTPSKTAYNQVYSAIKTMFSPGRLLRTSVYINSGGTQYVSVNGAAATTAGAGSWTPLAATNAVEYEGCGGGGGGGGSGGQGSSTVGIGQSGGSGAFGRGLLTSGFSGTQTITVGTGGAGGTIAPTAGGNGGTTSFGSLATWSGGGGGSYVNGVTTPAITGAPGGGVGPSGCNIISSKGSPGGTGQAASITVGVSGQGGSTPYGSGGGGVAFGSAGNPGGGAGTGGSGGATGGSGTGMTGGAGAGGLLIIREYA